MTRAREAPAQGRRRLPGATEGRRPSEAWRDLLGEDRFRLAATVAGELGEAPETTATRLWTIVECLKKAGAPYDTR